MTTVPSDANECRGLRQEYAGTVLVQFDMPRLPRARSAYPLSRTRFACGRRDSLPRIFLPERAPLFVRARLASESEMQKPTENRTDSNRVRGRRSGWRQRHKWDCGSSNTTRAGPMLAL